MEETNNTQQNSNPAVAATPTIKTEEPKYAGFFLRTAAVFTDIWFYIIVLFILGVMPVHVLHPSAYEIYSKIFSLNLFIVLCILSKIFLFDTVLNGKTPGRLLYNLRVTDIEGNPLAWQKRILRSCISMILLVIAIYGISKINYFLDTPPYRRDDSSLIYAAVSLLFVLAIDFPIVYFPKNQSRYDKLLGSVVQVKKEMREKTGCFLYIWALISIVTPFLVLLVMGMLGGLAH